MNIFNFIKNIFKKKDKEPTKYKIVTLENKLGQRKYMACADIGFEKKFVALCYSKYGRYIREAFPDDDAILDTYELAERIINEHKEKEAKDLVDKMQAEQAKFVPVKTDVIE